MRRLASSWKWDWAKAVTEAMTAVRMAWAEGPDCWAAAIMRDSPELFAGGVVGFGDAVGGEEEAVAGEEGDGLVGEGGGGEDAEDGAGALEGDRF